MRELVMSVDLLRGYRVDAALPQAVLYLEFLRAWLG